MLFRLFLVVLLARVCQGSEKLKVTVSPRDALEGKPVKIQCEVPSKRLARFQWLQLPPATASRRQLSMDNSTIVISSLHRSDGADYKCIATTDDGITHTGSTKLDVYYPPQSMTLRLSPHGDPVARSDRSPAHVAVAKGASLTLICEGDSNPTLIMAWKRGSEEIDHWTSEYTVEQPQEAVYTCEAVYEIANVKYNVSVNVTIQEPVSKPQVKVESTVVLDRAGAVTMTCSHDMNTQPEYGWLRNNRPISAQEERHTFIDGGASLRVESVRRTDTGDYRCAVWNDVSKETSEPVAVTILEAVTKPRVEMDRSEALEGTHSVTMTCSHHMSTQPEYSWLRDNRPISAPEERHKFIDGNASLRVENVQKEDAGLYQCVVKNSLSTETSDPVRMTVLEAATKPRVEMDSSEALEGTHSVTMTCSHHMSTQPEYSWLRDNRPISASKERHKFLDGNASLRMENVKKEDAGLYQCVVKNSLSAETSDPVMMTVLEAVTKPRVEMDRSEALEGTHSVTMTCSHDMSTQPEYSWLRNNRPISAPEERCKFLDGNASLRVENVKKEDAGLYQCVVKNSLSTETSDPVKMTVLEAVTKPRVEMDRSEALEGTHSVTMTCSHDMSTQPEYSWLRNNRPISAPEERCKFLDGNASLRVENVKKEDAGLYQCVVKNSLSTETSDPVKMTVLEAATKPRVEMDRSEALEGTHSVTMTCSHDMSTQPEYSWLWDNRPISALEERHKFFDGNASLRVENVKKEDAGLYQCVVKNSLSTETSDPVMMTVLEAVTKPRVDMDRSEALEGTHSVTMTCSHDMSTQPEYSWLRNNRPISAPEERRKFLDGNASLRVENVKKEDAGLYQCVVKNSLSTETSDPVMMTVLEAVTKPRVEMDRSEALEGTHSVTMTCSHHMSTQPEYSWLRDNRPISASEERHKFLDGIASLRMENVKKEDAGLYQCVVKNSLSAETSDPVMMTVLEAATKPRVEMDSSEALEGTHSVTMTCSHHMSTQPEYSWLRDNRPISASEERHKFLDGNASLRMENVKKEDAGLYQCVVKNSLSAETSDPVMMTVLEAATKPRVEMDRSEALEGTHSVTMTCSHDMSTQPEYSWLRDNRPISASEERHKFLDGNASLRMENVKKEDAGLYQCVVKNSLSAETSDPVMMTVLGRVSKPQVNMNERKVEEGHSPLIMTCTNSRETGHQFLWFQDERLISAPDQRLSLSNGGATLRVEVVQLSDAGEYTCLVQNNASEAISEPVTLTVLESLSKPEVKVNDSVARDGDTRAVRLDCWLAGRARGGASYSWLLDGRRLAEEPGKYETSADGASLLVLPAAVGASGEFQCEVRNGLSSKKSEPVKLPPPARAKASPQVILGATLGTLVSAAAAGLVFWTYRKVAFSRSGAKGRDSVTNSAT
ncbi:hemicentin-2-like isoform X2 [Lethenteron reissneri]|uniref:hemicentin-2-like isoform X2 n=1 Tax=Lethenteron reissneri TaxID=7753 RepID=UPI002AB7730E|nr:hemicentin-2-like isoform X2 [Lethenteron reissneri]